MSILKRGKGYTLRIRPFGELINVKTSARTKQEAKQAEMAILTACRAGDYRGLDPIAREACMRMFRNQGWDLPLDLSGDEPVREELTFWKAVEILLNYPGVKDSATRERYIYALSNIVKKWGKNLPVKQIWVPVIRQYMADRLSDEASPGTINREKGTLSRLFQVLVELQYIEVNPVRLVKPLSEREGQREVCVSYEDFLSIVDRCPEWCKPFVLTLYYTGMRRGEAHGLTRKQVNLSHRMIFLGARATKERATKRVPIHRDLVPVLEEAVREDPWEATGFS